MMFVGVEKSLADMRSDGETENIHGGCGGKFQNRFSELCNRHRIKREFTNPDTPRLSGCVERALATLK